MAPPGGDAPLCAQTQPLGAVDADRFLVPRCTVWRVRHRRGRRGLRGGRRARGPLIRVAVVCVPLSFRRLGPPPTINPPHTHTHTSSREVCRAVHAAQRTRTRQPSARKPSSPVRRDALIAPKTCLSGAKLELTPACRCTFPSTYPTYTKAHDQCPQRPCRAACELTSANTSRTREACRTAHGSDCTRDNGELQPLRPPAELPLPAVGPDRLPLPSAASMRDAQRMPR